MRRIKLLYNILFVALVFIVLASSISSSIIVDRKIKSKVMHWLPQGWAFFTRSPREEQVSIYKKVGNSFKEVNLRNSSSEFFFGLSREGRVRGYEISQILQEVPQRRFRSGTFNEFANAPKDSIIKVRTKKELYCLNDGIYILKAYESLPWAWLRFDQARFVPARYMTIKLENSE